MYPTFCAFFLEAGSKGGGGKETGPGFISFQTPDTFQQPVQSAKRRTMIGAIWNCYGCPFAALSFITSSLVAFLSFLLKSLFSVHSSPSHESHINVYILGIIEWNKVLSLGTQRHRIVGFGGGRWGCAVGVLSKCKVEGQRLGLWEISPGRTIDYRWVGNEPQMRCRTIGFVFCKRHIKLTSGQTSNDRL